MGCGTGLLACEFATRGYDVTGADPAAAMLAAARGRPGGDQVRWIQADAAGLATGTSFDLVIMTGHVFQLLLEDRDVRAALGPWPGTWPRAAGSRSRPGTRPCASGRTGTRGTPGSGWRRPVSPPTCTTTSARSQASWSRYETWFQFAGARDPVVVPDTLRFMDQAQVAAFLAEAGLAQVTWYGDWDGSPYGQASPEIIAVASGDRPASRAQ